MAGKDVEIVIGAKDLASKILDGVNASTSRLQASVLKASVVMTGAFAAFQTVRGLASVFLEQVDAVDKLATSATKLGTTVNELEGFHFALETIGNIEFGAADAMLTKMAVNIGKNSGAFKDLKLDIAALSKGSTTAAFQTIVDALRKVENDTQQLALATEIFGKSGADLIPVIRETAEIYSHAANESERLGRNLSAIEISKIQEADAALESMSRSMTGLVRSITAEIAPALTGIAGGFENANGKANVFVKYIGTAVGSIGLMGHLINDIFTDSSKLWGEAGTGLDKFLDDLKFAQMAAKNTTAVTASATVADAARQEMDRDVEIAAKKEEAQKAAIDRIAAHERDVDAARMESFKKLNEDVLADIQREKDDLRKRDKDAAKDIADQVDPTRVIKRRIDEIKRLMASGDLDKKFGSKALENLQFGDRRASKESTQAFEGRLLTRGGPGQDPVAKNTKDALSALKNIDNTLKEVLRYDKQTQTLRLQVVQ